VCFFLGVCLRAYAVRGEEEEGREEEEEVEEVGSCVLE